MEKPRSSLIPLMVVAALEAHLPQGLQSRQCPSCTQPATALPFPHSLKNTPPPAGAPPGVLVIVLILKEYNKCNMGL